MKLFCHGEDVPDRPCCSLDSVNDARRVCEQLGIPHYVLNLETRSVTTSSRISSTSMRAGARRFPACAATRSRSSAISSRRLTRSTRSGSRPAITRASSTACCYRGRDDNKDQTYFLWGIDRAVLVADASAGRQTRRRPRLAHARTRWDWQSIAEKPESQEICFVPDGDYARILEQRLPVDAPALSRGPIMTSERRRRRRARGIRALHDRPAARSAGGIRASHVRRRDSSR